MRILVMQFAPRIRGKPVPRFDPQLGTLMALLQQRDHELGMCGLSGFDEEAVKSAMAKLLPQLIFADISSVCVDAARRTLQYVEQHQFVPVVAGGQFPAVEPQTALSLPAVHAVAIGEPDATLATYLERLKDPAVGQVVSGVWLRDEKGLSRPDMPPLIEDLDSLPFPERELFNYAEHVRKTGELELAVGRGCPQQCAYCTNDWLESLYDEEETWTRRRSADNVLEEIDLLRTRYEAARSVRFLDHAFALDSEWLGVFLEAYHDRCDLPFRCHLRANAAESATVRALADAGCQMTDIEVISGSDFVRNEIFEMDLSGEQITAAFEAVRAAGMRTRAIVYLGAPYESEASLDETGELLRELRPDVVDIRSYYPFPGTGAADTARENGWLHPRGEEQFHKQACGVNVPVCRPEIVAAYERRLRHEFPSAQGAPWWRRWSPFRR